MPTRLIPIGDLTDVQRAQWRALAGAAAEPNPFFEPELVEPAWRHLPRRGRVALLVASDGADWLACLPVRHTGVAPAAFAGWHHPYGFLATPLIRRDALAAGAQALLAPLRQRRTALFALHLAGAEGAVDRALAEAAEEAGLALAWDRPASRAAIDRTTESELPPKLSARRRSDLRRLRRRLEEQLGAAVGVVDRSHEQAALDRFLELEASGWKGANGTALASHDGHRRFFVEMATAFAADGRFRLHMLEADGRAVAATCELQSGDALFGFKSAYDERHQRTAPGLQLLHETVLSFCGAEQLRLLDSCSDPGNTLANEMLPGRRSVRTFALAARGAQARLLGRGIDAAIAARDRLRGGRSGRPGGSGR